MRRVLLIGWDGAGRSQINSLLDAGAMPNLARIVANGVVGDLTTLTPLCSPLLWTSIATGLFADEHGVLDTAEPDPVSGGVHPVTRASLSAPQIWDLLAQQGVGCQVTGWPATHPAQGPATCVSNGLAHGVPQSVWPHSLDPAISPLRFRPEEWTGAELQLFVPDLSLINQDQDKNLARLAVILAEAVTVHAAATTLMESDAPDFSAVWFGAVARALEIFPAGTTGIYGEVVDGVYRFLDLLLGRLVQLAGPDATVMVVSDRAAGEPEWHDSAGRGSRGLLCASGPGISPDELAFGSGILDIAPTVLRLFGYAAAASMPGRSIPEVCATAASRALPGREARFARHSPLVGTEPDADLERDLRELEELGYADSVAAAKRPEADAARTRRNFNLAQVLIARERFAEAVPVLEKAARENPDWADIRTYLAHAYRQCGRYSECREVCEELLAENPDSKLAPLARAHIAISEGNHAEAKRWLGVGQESYGIAAGLDSAIGLAYLRTNSWQEAAGAFRSAILSDPALPGAHEGLARALLGSGRHREAASAALDAIRLRYDLAGAHDVLGSALHALGRKEEAAGAFATREMLRSHLSGSTLPVA